MASPITHIVISEKIFPKFFSDKDKKLFLVGTSFPDIRYLGVIDRDKTHFFGNKISDLQKEDSFMCGLKFHGFVDEKREEYYQKNDVYKNLPKLKYKFRVLKFLEDHIFYSKIKDWKNIASYFDEVLPQELEFGIAEKDVRHWHFLLKEYFLNYHSFDVLEGLIAKMNFPAEVFRELKMVIELREKEEVVRMIEGMYEEFEKIPMTKSQ